MEFELPQFAQDTIAEFRASASTAFSDALSEILANANTTEGDSPELPDDVAASIDAQADLIGTGVEGVFADLSSDSLTNAPEANSDDGFQFNFEPAADGVFGGQLSLIRDGDTEPLFTFDVSGSSPVTGDNSSLPSNYQDFFASLAGGENPFASASTI
jgi:hypothetical protein